MQEFIFNLISTVLGTVTGAILAYLFALRQFNIQKRVDEKQKRVDTALSFFEELTNDSFSQARSETSRVFKENISAVSLDDFYSALPEEKRQPIRKVLSFFRRLQLAIEYQRIDDQMAIDLFSGEFLHWYFKWFDKLIPMSWDTRKNIDKMNNWLQKNMPPIKYEQEKEKTLKLRESNVTETQKGK